jgi:hypothetical protein
MAAAKTGMVQHDWIALALKQAIDRELGDWPYWQDQSAEIERSGPKPRKRKSLAEIQADRRAWNRKAQQACRKRKAEKAAIKANAPHCPTCDVPMVAEGEGHRCATCGKVFFLAL